MNETARRRATDDVREHRGGAGIKHDFNDLMIDTAADLQGGKDVVIGGVADQQRGKGTRLDPAAAHPQSGVPLKNGLLHSSKRSTKGRASRKRRKTAFWDS